MTDHPITRRLLIGGTLALGAVTSARAQIAPSDEVVPLWPGAIPGDGQPHPARKVDNRSKDAAHADRWVTGIEKPVLVVRRPARPNGAAMLIVPGGGYGFASYDNEGLEQAAWLGTRGITGFVLLYRLPREGWSDRAMVPLQDAQRAMRVIRAGATRFGIDARRVGVLGFSAGGHLAGSLATRPAERTYPPVDAADRLSARPDVAGLIYPVVSMSRPFTHGGSRDALLGDDASEALRRANSVETRVTADTPPVFLAHAGDDGLVPVANSLALYAALNEAKRPAELHAFNEGGHGFGTRLPPAMPASRWPELFHAFGVKQGVL